MICDQFITSAPRYRRSASGLMRRTPPLAGFDGRIAPIADSVGGHAP